MKSAYSIASASIQQCIIKLCFIHPLGCDEWTQSNQIKTYYISLQALVSQLFKLVLFYLLGYGKYESVYDLF